MITIEAMTWTVRIGENNHEMYDSYTGVCTATRAGVDTVRITALVTEQPFTLRQSIEMAKKFKAMGFNWAIWERIKDGRLVDVIKPL